MNSPGCQAGVRRRSPLPPPGPTDQTFAVPGSLGLVVSLERSLDRAGHDLSTITRAGPFCGPGVIDISHLSYSPPIDKYDGMSGLEAQLFSYKNTNRSAFFHLGPAVHGAKPHRRPSRRTPVPVKSLVRAHRLPCVSAPLY